jgi:hypothetical protein
MSFKQVSNFNDFLQYKKVKSALNFEYQGIPIEKTIAFELLNTIMFDFEQSALASFKLLFITIKTNVLLDAFIKHDVIFSTAYNSRRDHKNLLESIQKTVTNSTIVDLIPQKLQLSIKLKHFYIAFVHIFLNEYLRHFRLNQKIYLTASVIYVLNLIDELKKTFGGTDISNKKFIPFVSAVGPEALLTIFFNAREVKTFHIFHGLFGRYKIRIANDIVNGENITARWILAFGEVTKNDLISDFGIDPQAILVAGNPKYPAKVISIKQTFKRCLVLGGFKFYDNDFAELLLFLDQTAKVTGIRFDVKPHPNSDVMDRNDVKACLNLNFLLRSTSIQTLLSGEVYDFAISFNTVTYYECMYYGLVSLRYSVNENIDFDGLEDRFFNIESLLARIEYFQSLKSSDLDDMVGRLLTRTLGMGINRYNSIIMANTKN